MNILCVYLDLPASPFQFNYPDKKLTIHNSRNLEELHLQLMIASEYYDLIIVSDSLLHHWSQNGKRFDRCYLANWLRLLKPGGTLQLENIGYLSCHELGLETLLINYAHQNKNHYELIKKVEPKCTPQFASTLIRDSYELEKRNDIEGAIQALLIIWALQPNEFNTIILLGNIFLRQNWVSLSKQLWLNFVQAKPTFQNAILASVHLLMIGDYYEGFKLREMGFNSLPYSRRCDKNPPRDEIIAKRWQGEKLEGKHFVIWSEFGLGDEIMFSQLAYAFKQYFKIKKLTVIVQKPIFELIKTHPDIDEVVEVSKANEINDFDYWDWPHSLLSHIEITSFEEVPKRYPYLFATPEKQAVFTDRLRTHKKLRVGLAWRGDKTHENDRYRSIHNVTLLNQLLEIPNIEWFCLQKDLNESEQRWLAEHQIPSFSAELNDFTDTAGLVSQMDLVIAVDTSIAHLAGALNIPTFLMLPLPYDWRWGLINQQNQWYPSIKSFFPDYPEVGTMMPQVILKVKQALAEFSAQH